MTRNKPQARAGLSLRRKIRQVHRWLGLLVGIQVLLWIVGGLVMSSFDLELVRGEHLVRSTAPAVIEVTDDLISPAEILLAAPAPRLVLRVLIDRPVYEWHGSGERRLLDARTGERLDPLPEDVVRDLALGDYAGDADLSQLDWITEPALEYRGRSLPLWRARFDDALNTTLYISPTEGRVVARRNDVWRLFDFVWMLHIMDYQDRDDFNNPWLVTFAASALAFAISGLVMLWFSFRRRA